MFSLPIISLFIIHTNNYLFIFSELDDKEIPSSSLLDWKYAQDKLPWGIVLLLGHYRQ